MWSGLRMQTMRSSGVTKCVCVGGCPPRGAPGSLGPGGRCINPGSTLLLTLEVRKPEGGGHSDVGPRGQPRPRAVPGELEGLGSGAFGGVSRKAECAHSAFPCSGAWTRGHRERTLADGGSADSAGGVARAGSGNPHSHCPQCTRIPLQGKQPVTCPGPHTQQETALDSGPPPPQGWGPCRIQPQHSS